MLRKLITIVLIAALSVIGMVQCVGNFGLTRKMHGAIQGISNKWISWIVFLVLVIFQIYSIVLFVDAIVLNSIQFWTGRAVVSLDKFDDKGEFHKSLVKDNERMELTYRKYGEELLVSVYKNNEHKKTMLLKKSEPGVFYGNETGEWKPMKMSILEKGNLRHVSVKEGDKVIGTSSMGASEYTWVKGKADAIYAKATGADKTPAVTTSF